MSGDGRGELEKQSRTVVECWNRSDWAAYRALMGPGYLYAETGTGRRVEDVEVVMVRWRRLKTAFPDTAAEIVQVQGDVTDVEVI